MKRTLKQLNREIHQYRISRKDNLNLGIIFSFVVVINLLTELGGNKISEATIHLTAIALLIGNFYRVYKDSKEIKKIQIRILEIKNNT